MMSRVQSSACATAARINWHSYAPPTGYGIAAERYVAALAQSGAHKLRWVTHDYVLPRHQVRRDEVGDDIDVNVMHMVPDRMPGLASPRAPNLAYTVFETDRMPAHWSMPLRKMDRIAVPCTWNQTVFAEALGGRGVECIPHLSEFHGERPLDLRGAPSFFPIPEETFVFLTVATWEPRKNLDGLVRAYLDAFDDRADVLLVIKTSHWSHDFRSPRSVRREPTARALMRLTRGRHRCPRIFLCDRELAPQAMRHLYARADAYVTLTRGEGWGYGCFESAWFGKPVIATGFGGYLDYLPPDLACLVDFRLTPYRRAHWEHDALAQHRYAEPDHADAVAKLRWVFTHREVARVRGERLRDFVSTRFDPASTLPRLTRFLEAGLAERRVPAHVRLARFARRVPNANDKYFHEIAGHFDHRFFVGELGTAERVDRLRRLLRAFCEAVEPLGVRPFLLHGGLIGWAWNGRLLPWDADIDLGLPLADLERLYTSRFEIAYDRSELLLDINPHFTDRQTLNETFRDTLEPNKIDARFIDRATGLYLDITALAADHSGALVTKCPHRYPSNEIYPLRNATFEGVALWVPHDHRAVLEREYGPGVLSDPRFGDWTFDAARRQWRERTIVTVSRWARRGLGVVWRRLVR